MTFLDGMEQLLTTKEVVRLISLSRQEIHRRRCNGSFPQPIRLGARRVGYRREEIEAWIAARVAERDRLAAERGALKDQAK